MTAMQVEDSVDSMSIFAHFGSLSIRLVCSEKNVPHSGLV